jgi:hypothetical protein
VKIKRLDTASLNLEDTLQHAVSEFASKDAFAKLLDSSFEQIRSLSAVSEAAKQRSNQSVALFESLVHALFDLKGTDSAGFRMDFLSSLSGDMHQENVSRLLLDSLRTCIDASVDTNLKTAVGKFHQSLSVTVKDLQNRQDASAKQTVDKVLTITDESCEALERRIHSTLEEQRSSALENREVAVFTPALQATIERMDRELAALRQSNAVLQGDNRFCRESLSSHKTLIDDLITNSRSSIDASVTAEALRWMRVVSFFTLIVYLF